MTGALYGLLPAGLSLLFYLLAPFIGAVGALTPPLAALIRSLPGALFFFGPPPAFARDPVLGVLYLAYAGRCSTSGGFWARGWGSGLGFCSFPFCARRRGFASWPRFSSSPSPPSSLPWAF